MDSNIFNKCLINHLRICQRTGNWLHSFPFQDEVWDEAVRKFTVLSISYFCQ